MIINGYGNVELRFEKSYFEIFSLFFSLAIFILICILFVKTKIKQKF